MDSVCDYDLPAPQESAPGRAAPPGASLLARARAAAPWPRPAALTPAAEAAAAPFEKEAEAAPLEDGDLRYLLYEGTPAADVFLERRLAAAPAEAADPELFLEAARFGTVRAVRALVRAGAWAAWGAPPAGPEGFVARSPPRSPEGPLVVALGRRDAQALDVIAELAGSAPRVGLACLQAGLAGLGLAAPPTGAGGGARPPLPVYVGPGRGRLGVLLAAGGFGPAAAAALLGARPREDFPHGLAEALEALGA